MELGINNLGGFKMGIMFDDDEGESGEAEGESDADESF